MTDKNKRNPQEESQSKLRKMSRRRWFYPAVYLGVAALVMTGVLWFQGGENQELSDMDNKQNGEFVVDQNQKDAVPVNGMNEEFKWPVADKSAVEISQQFYDANAPKDKQKAALVSYNNTYVQSTGINISAKDSKSFDVTAAMSGTVVTASETDILGNKVVIKHGKDVRTVYSSLKKVAVEPGQEVEQGDKIGVSGRSQFNQDAGVHLHFEIRKEAVPVNPVAYFGKDLGKLKTIQQTTADEGSDAEGNKQQDKAEGRDMKNAEENKNPEPNKDINTDPHSKHEQKDGSDSDKKQDSGSNQ